MVGNNEDAWRENSHIWFEVGREGHYGAAYVGHDDEFPQGGMNEAGLVMVRRLRPLYLAHLVCFGVLVGLSWYWGFYV